MYETPIIMLDFETNGASPAYGSRITEVAAVRIVHDEIVDRFVTLVNCNVYIPAYITKFTGITQSMVDNAPCVSQVIPELIKFIGKDILAAHNVGFDNKFLLSESYRLGLAPHYKDLLCSVKLSRRILYGLPSYKLTNLAASLGIEFNGRAHRAEADAEVAAKVLIHIGQKIKDDYKIDSFDPDILVMINKLNSMQISKYLENIFSDSK